jgi:hypothetical protein
MLHGIGSLDDGTESSVHRVRATEARGEFWLDDCDRERKSRAVSRASAYSMLREDV